MRKKFVFAGAAALLIGLVAVSIIAIGGRNSQKVITMAIDGTSKISVTPDVLNVSVTISSGGASNSEATQKVATTMQGVVDVLKADGTKDGDIQSGTISNQRGYCGYSSDGASQAICPRNDSTSTGFARADVTIQIRDMSHAGKVLSDSLAVPGATVELTSGSFDVSNQDAISADAQSKAVANARARANGIAKSSGLHVKRIVDISVGDKPTPVPYRVDSKALSGAVAALPQQQTFPVQPGSQDVSASVTVTYEMQ